ncbi:peroxiredoxin family protein [Sungkyunkwania multivorans]|uniref:Peroxiredoxin family protein n=1 Tax=Sungkyunkwania multivorans TaxID=1173618 RepID=A0ABW3CUN1_9FLAO
MKKFLLSVIVIACLSCKNENNNSAPKSGTWRATLTVQDNETLPFIFEYTPSGTVKIFNAEEVIEVDEVMLKGDSIYIRPPVFEGYIAGTFTEQSIQGQFIKPSLDRIVPFKAEYGNEDRFDIIDTPKVTISGTWETVFSPESDKDSYIAKGIFNQEKDKVTGTFRTTTGDYRYLEGVVDGNELRLSTFDGAHAFLFTAAVTDSTMSGTFYSGNHWKEPFVAKRNPNYELPDEHTLTFLKEGYDRLGFSFPNEDGHMVSLSDKEFKNKVVVVQIMGTWCPNCLDESKYYSEFYKQHKDQDVAFVALAFEYAKTQELAWQRINRLKEHLRIDYPILLAQYGTSDKQKANEKLPMLNHILSYPTSIFIDKKGQVRKVHTGFNGPATGEKYHEFKHEFEDFLEQLSSEESL